LSSEYRPHPRASKPRPAPADGEEPPRGAPDPGPILGASGEPLGVPAPPAPRRDETPRRQRVKIAIAVAGLVPLVAVIVTLIRQVFGD
jgi:hypothetical protein